MGADDTLSSFQLFLCGLAAGTCAKAVCHPLDVVKKRFQVYFRFQLLIIHFIFQSQLLYDCNFDGVLYKARPVLAQDSLILGISLWSLVACIITSQTILMKLLHL